MALTAFSVPSFGLPSEPLHAVQVLKRGNGAEPESLDPALSQSTPAGAIISDMFEGLTALDAEGEVVPGVAHSWRQRDPTTWEFDLRESKWSNGDPVTAQDFVYAWQRYFDPATAAPSASSFDYFFQNGRAVNSGELPPTALGVRVIDSHRLEVLTAFPVPYFPEILAHSNLVPVHRATIEANGPQWVRPGVLVGNGAFTLSDWRVNSRVSLVRSPTYWDASNVLLTNVHYASVEDHFAEFKLYAAGELDITKGLPSGAYQRLKKERPNELYASPALIVRYYSLNNTDPLLKDKRVRQALSMVVDRDILTERITADGEVPAYSVAISGITGARNVPYEWADWPMAQKVSTAQALLAAANVKPGTRLKLIYNTNDIHKKVALFLASEWKTKLGLQISLENMEFRVLLRERNAGNFQIARDGWAADYRDISSMLAVVRCRSTQNSNRSCNEAAEALLVQAQTESDLTTRIDLQTQATTQIMQDYPMIPLSQMSDAHLVKSYVGGYGKRNPVGRYRSQYLYIRKH